jgi:hypothetical protein
MAVQTIVHLNMDCEEFARPGAAWTMAGTPATEHDARKLACATRVLGRVPVAVGGSA